MNSVHAFVLVVDLVDLDLDLDVDLCDGPRSVSFFIWPRGPGC